VRAPQRGAGFFTYAWQGRAGNRLSARAHHGIGSAAAASASARPWSSLRQGDCRIVLTSTQPRLDVPALPLLFYFYFDDLAVVLRGLEEGGVATAHMGYPPHARGGEVRITDPDGNTVLLGQLDPSASQPAGQEPTSRFSLLREAAAVVRAGGGTSTGCQVVDLLQQPCPAKADVKLADPDGGSLWACLRHADEILLTVPTAFIANPSGAGLSGYRSRRPLTAPRHPQPG